MVETIGVNVKHLRAASASGIELAAATMPDTQKIYTPALNNSYMIECHSSQTTPDLP